MCAVPVEQNSVSIKGDRRPKYQTDGQADGRANRRVHINLASMAQAVERLASDAERKKGFTLFTLNLDHLVKLRFDEAFRRAYRRASYVSADGWPVVSLARARGVELERTTGADMVKPLCAEAARRKLPVYLFGSSEQSLRQAADHLLKLYPELIIAGSEAPPYGFEPLSAAADEAAARVSASGARLCFVALGAPKQELFADRAFEKHPDIGFLCIGAALDFLAGHQQRAPEIMRRTGTEWLYRLAVNPRRLFGRYVGSALMFAEMIIRHSLRRPDERVEFSVRDLEK